MYIEFYQWRLKVSFSFGRSSYSYTNIRVIVSVKLRVKSEGFSLGSSVAWIEYWAEASLGYQISRFCHISVTMN